MGHFAYNSPLFLSSSLIAHSFPFDTKRIRPVHAGSAKFQSAALKSNQLFLSCKLWAYLCVLSLMLWGVV